MKNKVFGIGLSRTGTVSLHKQLIELGFVSQHSSGQLIKDHSFDVMRDLDALSDSPVPLLYQELDRRYPNSKFILTTRNKDAWLHSMDWMLTHGKAGWDWSKSVQNYHREFYGTKKFDRETLSNCFDRFHSGVNTYFRDRPGDLLVFDLDHGGFDSVALCDFLNVPRRHIEIPKANQRRDVPWPARFKYWLKELVGLR